MDTNSRVPMYDGLHIIQLKLYRP